jgi:predicted XRE-type DNA-binding protein
MKQDEFNKFKNHFDNFLLHRAIINNNVDKSLLLDTVNSMFDIRVSEEQEAYKVLQTLLKYKDAFDTHYASLSEEQKAEQKTKAFDLRSDIATMLNTRLLGIKGTKALSQDQKIKYTQVTNLQVSNLLNNELSTASSLASLYAVTIP